MKTATLIRRNLIWYYRVNLAVVLGVATAIAVMAGALLVGHSVRRSLHQLSVGRLGRADLMITGPGFFRERLAGELRTAASFQTSFSDVASLIALTGVATRDENRSRAGGVSVFGIDQTFESFQGIEIGALEPGEALISPGLAVELGAQPGEMLALQIEVPTTIPIESLHGRRDETGRTIRLSLRGILPAASGGEFSLRPQQGPVRAIFLPLSELQRNLDQDGQVNVMLLATRRGVVGARQAAEGLISDHFTLADFGVRVRQLPAGDAGSVISVETKSAIISDPLAGVITQVAQELGVNTNSYLSYLANSIRANSIHSGAKESVRREIPYSLVTAVEPGVLPGLVDSESDALPPIVLNTWAAADLAAQIGDEISLDYYVWKDEGRLDTDTARFRLVGIVPMTGLAADRNLAPEYPGITGAESLSDWDPPFPLDLSLVRESDEDYWDRYRATPKAFLLLDDARPRWSTRHGGVTSIRLGRPGELDENRVSTLLRRLIGPETIGLVAIPLREQSEAASRGATDFGAYFSYFSFFLVISALLLVVLFFRLGLEQRTREIGLYRSFGYQPSLIGSIFLREGLLLSLVGGLLGLIGAVAYGALMVIGLRTVWTGAVGTRLLELHLDLESMFGGLLGGLFASAICIWLTLRSICHATPRSQLAGLIGSDNNSAVDRASVKRPIMSAL
ncbi:MAG: ABC transporter permease, partial [Acidobacteria bacterium]|nr:ABC transporter permease [Acidobacteriota bacterium]